MEFENNLISCGATVIRKCENTLKDNTECVTKNVTGKDISDHKGTIHEGHGFYGAVAPADIPIDNIICIAVDACLAPNKPGGNPGIIGLPVPPPDYKRAPIPKKKEGTDTEESTSDPTDHNAEDEPDEDEEEGITITHGDLKSHVVT